MAAYATKWFMGRWIRDNLPAIGGHDRYMIAEGLAIVINECSGNGPVKHIQTNIISRTEQKPVLALLSAVGFPTGNAKATPSAEGFKHFLLRYNAKIQVCITSDYHRPALSSCLYVSQQLPDIAVTHDIVFHTDAGVEVQIVNIDFNARRHA